MKVKDVMRGDPIAVAETARIGDVVDIVYRQGIRHVPVVDGDELIGIISDRDLREVATPALLPSESRPLKDLPVRNLMSTSVLTVCPDDDVLLAIEHIVDGDVGAVPVVEAGSRRLVGIVSYVDLLRALADRLRA